MLERVAVHQTRLRTPGLGLDAKGVALGAKGLVLLPSVDRLVAFIALYARQGSLSDLLPSLSVDIARSKLGLREVVLTFAADSSHRLDKITEIARLAGGFTFTGTSRHFVQYRDAAAPFGYDIGQVTPSDAPLVLYHSAFTQTYELETRVDFRRLLVRLELHVDPKTREEKGPKHLLAEAGLGPMLIQYFVRSSVTAEVGVAEWPPASSFEDTPILRYLFRVPELPDRMMPLLSRTPGLTMFLPAGPGVAVEVGYRHPVNLRSCPVFDASGLVFFRGEHQEALELNTVPALGDVTAFARIELKQEDTKVAPGSPCEVDAVRIALRMLPSVDRFRRVTATWVSAEEVPLLRRLAYALSPDTVRLTRIAVTPRGVFLVQPKGIEGLPVGEFFREIGPELYIPAGYDPAPAVAPEVIFRALGAPSGRVVFIDRSGTAFGIQSSAFVPLSTALLEAQTWASLEGLSEGLEAALAVELPQVFLPSPGVFPLRDLQSPKALSAEPPPPALPEGSTTIGAPDS